MTGLEVLDSAPLCAILLRHMLIVVTETCYLFFLYYFLSDPSYPVGPAPPYMGNQ